MKPYLLIANALCLILNSRAANLTLIWDPSITPYVTYNVYQNTLLFTNTPNITVSLTYNESITNTFYVKSKSIMGFESTPSNIITLSPSAPAPPTNLRITELSNRKRNISWTVSNNVNSIVEKAIESSNFSYVATLQPGVMNWIDTRSRQKLTRYRIQACNQLCSSWSEITFIP